MANVFTQPAAAQLPSCVVAARRCGLGVLLAIFVLGVQSLTFAQQYQADQVDDKLRAQGLVALNLVKNPAGYAAGKQDFLTFFSNYYFPAMTRFGANDLAELGKMRSDLFGRFLIPAGNADLQRELTDLAYTKMRGVIVSKDKTYHPAVRYNAILVIGLLDKQYPIDTGPNRRPSVPHPEANKLLRQIVSVAASGKPVDPALLIGALVGLERHAQFRDSLDRDAPAAMTESLRKLVMTEPLAAQTNRSVSDWIRMQAATTLAKLGSPGEKGEVNADLLKLAAGETDPKLPLDMRSQVAALLALLKYEGATIDGKATADSILKLANEIVEAEQKEATSFEQMHLRSFSEGPPPKGRATFDLQTRQPVYERRTLLARFSDIRRAMEATRPVVPAEQQATYDAVLNAIRPIIDAAGNKDEVDLTLAEKIGTMSAAVKQAINPSATPASDEAAADVF